jgi:hypothetical protein
MSRLESSRIEFVCIYIYTNDEKADVLERNAAALLLDCLV